MWSEKRRLAALVCAVSLIAILVAGCPTLPDRVSGGSVGGDGTGPPPGELIEWPGAQVDPTGEDTAGFNQVVSADMDGDGLVDLVTAAYESQPIQLHLQRRSTDGSISFQSFSVAGSGPIVQVSALRVADVDQDGNLDIILSAQDNGFQPLIDCATKSCSVIVLFAPPDPSDALQWDELNITRITRCQLINQSPNLFTTQGFFGNDACFTDVDVGDVNNDGFPDIVGSFNGCDDDQIPTKQVFLWINPADENIRFNDIVLGSLVFDTDNDGIDDTCEADVITPWRRVKLQQTFPDIGGVRFSDIDLDGDLDVLSFQTNAKTFDLTWQENPLIPDDFVEKEFWGDAFATLHPIGESDVGLDLIEPGDLDGDGFEDVLAISKGDGLLKWFRRPKDPAAQTFPWEVFNMVQFTDLTPTAMDIADLDGDGQLDVVVAAEGRIRWFTPLAESPFEPWAEQFVINDPLIPDGSSQNTTSPFAPINSIHAVDIDGDGRLDITVTLDRAGVNDDILAWFKNQEIEDESP